MPQRAASRDYRRIFVDAAWQPTRIDAGVTESVRHLWLGVHGFAQLTSVGRSGAALGADPIMVARRARMLVCGVLRLQA